MSQYPSPYSPPPYPQQYGYYPPPQDPLAPAKRASTMMFVVGPLVILMGTCMLLLSFALDAIPIQAEQQQVMEQVKQATGLEPRTFLLILGIVMMVPGLLNTVLGVFVRRGGMGSIIASCVLSGLILTWIGINLLGSALHPIGPSAGMSICFGVCVFITFGAQLALLVNAARAAPHAAAMRQQYQAQYWQYQQNMQAYQQGGYQAPMTPPPPPPTATDDRDQLKDNDRGK